MDKVGVGKLVQIYCLRQLCQIWQAQMVSLQMAGRYLRVSSFSEKDIAVHFHLSLDKFTWKTKVHSQMTQAAGSVDLIVSSCGQEEPCCCWGADCSSEWILSFFFFFLFLQTFLFFWSFIKGTTHFLNPCLYFCRVRKSGQLLFMAEIFTM